jgi:hypothetical protein
MQYDRVFSTAVSGELQITPFCALQRMDARIPDAAHSGGYLEPSLCMPLLTRTSAAWTCS